MYTASVKIYGQTFSGKGETAKEAIAGIQVKNAKTKCVLTVSNGDKSKERVLGPVLSSRLFNSTGLMREIHLKNASVLFDGI